MGGYTKPLKGQLLLDGGKLQGSFFHRTVVLVCQHDRDGAFGLVLNRAMENSIGEMIIEDMPEALKEQPLFIGGPVQPGALSFLHADHFIPEANVMPNVQVGHSLEDLIEIAQSHSASKRLRVFAGYAGWSAGQLDEEMDRKSWLTLPATDELVFFDGPANLWGHILHKMSWKHRLLADSPDDVNWN